MFAETVLDAFLAAVIEDTNSGESRVLSNGCFDFIGAPIGSAPFCAAHTAEQVNKASALLDSLATLPRSTNCAPAAAPLLGILRTSIQGPCRAQLSSRSRTRQLRLCHALVLRFLHRYLYHRHPVAPGYQNTRLRRPRPPEVSPALARSLRCLTNSDRQTSCHELDFQWDGNTPGTPLAEAICVLNADLTPAAAETVDEPIPLANKACPSYLTEPSTTPTLPP
jgi:hypothetical protein